MRLIRPFIENLWVATVSFILFSTLIALSLSIEGLNAAHAAIALTLGLLATGLTLRRMNCFSNRLDSAPQDTWFWQSAVWICFGLFALRSFLWLIFEKDGMICVLSVNNLGDLPKHIQYTRFLAGGASIWPVNPLHAHSTIGYSFGVDYFNALLLSVGMNLQQGLVLTGLVACLATGVALQCWGGNFGMASFLFNGGMAGAAFFTTWKWVDYQQRVDWKSIPLALFVTQQGFLYALPAGLLLLTHWRRMHSFAEAPPKDRALPFWLEWLVYGTMPLFHLHSFLFLSVMLGWLACFGFRRARLWRLIGCSLLPAGVVVALLTDGFRAGSHLAWQPGWMQGPQFSATYWLSNFGVWPVFLALMVAVIVVKWSDPSMRAAALFVFPAVLLFIATLFIKFAPWEWDNTKLMMWGYLTLMPFLWQVVVLKTPFLLRVGMCGLLFFSGFLSLWGGLGPQFRGYELADRSEVADVGQAVKNFPIEAIFASAPEYAHPLVLNGRRLALAYHGHLVGHGIEYQKEKAEMDELMNGGPAWTLAAADLGASYLYWGLAEEKNWPQSTRAWITEDNCVAAGTWGAIYRLVP